MIPRFNFINRFLIPVNLIHWVNTWNPPDFFRHKVPSSVWIVPFDHELCNFTSELEICIRCAVYTLEVSRILHVERTLPHCNTHCNTHCMRCAVYTMTVSREVSFSRSVQFRIHTCCQRLTCICLCLVWHVWTASVSWRPAAAPVCAFLMCAVSASEATISLASLRCVPLKSRSHLSDECYYYY